jgi:hypothetical protein
MIGAFAPAGPRLWPTTVAAVLIFSAAVAGGQDPARADADRMSKKVQAILARAEAPTAQAKPLTTSFTEAELNAYLRLDPTVGLPVGLKHPTVTLLDNGRVDSKALVDLDAVRTSEKRGWLDPLAYVTGIMEVRTIGTFRGSNGKGTYVHESATLGGVPIPKSVLAELLHTDSRDAEGHRAGHAVRTAASHSRDRTAARRGNGDPVAQRRGSACPSRSCRNPCSSSKALVPGAPPIWRESGFAPSKICCCDSHCDTKIGPVSRPSPH